MAKSIWLPKSETTVTVSPEGDVSVTTSMVMEQSKIQTPVGFGKKSNGD